MSDAAIQIAGSEALAPRVQANAIDIAERKFALIQRQARAYADSELVPKEYVGKVANCVIALELADRLGASALMVMQNLAIIHGRPSWSSPFIISAINSCGRFRPLRFKLVAEDSERDFVYEVFENDYSNGKKTTKVVKKTTRILNKTCTAWTMDSSGEVLESPKISIEMACLEGWFDKSGSKWRTMPDLMLRYRAAAFFGRLYAPDVLMGMHTAEEIEDFAVIEGGEFNQDVSERPSPARAGQIADAVITTEQAREFGRVYKAFGFSATEASAWVVENLGVNSTLKIPAARFEEAMTWARSKHQPAEPSQDEKIARQGSSILGWSDEKVAMELVACEGNWSTLALRVGGLIDSSIDSRKGA